LARHAALGAFSGAPGKPAILNEVARSDAAWRRYEWAPPEPDVRLSPHPAFRFSAPGSWEASRNPVFRTPEHEGAGQEAGELSGAGGSGLLNRCRRQEGVVLGAPVHLAELNGQCADLGLTDTAGDRLLEVKESPDQPQ